MHYPVLKSKLSYFLHSIPTFFFIILSVLCVATLTVAKQDYDARRSLLETELPTKIVAPESLPELDQASVDLALAMYNIHVPSHVSPPKFDSNLEDRGLTTLRGWGKKLEVAVGPAAFESWGLLGSTLAHEIEVHCHQNFTVIQLKDMVGMGGTSEAEREAYMHELEHAHRFDLSNSEYESIEATMNFYYPASSPDQNQLVELEGNAEEAL